MYPIVVIPIFGITLVNPIPCKLMKARFGFQSLMAPCHRDTAQGVSGNSREVRLSEDPEPKKL